MLQANLTDATLTFADLSGAVMVGAVLRRSDLTQAKLAAVDIKDTAGKPSGRKFPTNLTNAILSHAKFDKADLRAAILRGAEITRTSFLNALTEGARGSANLLELSVEAARAKATVGEISLALEKVFGRHKAKADAVQGVYLKAAGDTPASDRARALTAEFNAVDGRKPRILVAKMGQDGHDRGQKVIASGFTDLGFDVEIGDLFQTPAEAAELAVKTGVHLVGASSLAAGHLTLVPELKAELARLGRPDILVVVGGVIPPEDFDALREAGVAAIFTPGTVVPEAAIEVMDRLNEALGYAQLKG
jgi:methylmalonyl-CoA mutase